MSGKPWTVKELRYVSEHAPEGAEAIAEALGRPVRSVQKTACRNGISLRKRWQCPRCAKTVYTPLNPRTGWCRACSMATRSDELEQELRDMREEAARIESEAKRRQALYSAKNRTVRRNDGKNTDKEAAL